MRALLFYLLVLIMSGCSRSHDAPPQEEVAEPIISQFLKDPVPPARLTTVKLYNSAEELIGKPFRDLGQVAGEVCQIDEDSPAPSIAMARKRMQSRAIAMKANAVLLHSCKIISETIDCHQKAICQGSALKVSSK